MLERIRSNETRYLLPPLWRILLALGRSHGAPDCVVGVMTTVQELSDNAWDIGVVSGVLEGIKLTPALLPKQIEAIDDALKAAARMSKRNRRWMDMERSS